VVSFIGFRYATRGKPDPPARPPVAKGKTRVCVTGFSMSPPTAHAHYLAHAIQQSKPDEFETWYYFDNFLWSDFAVDLTANVPFPPHLKGHGTSPFVWLESGDPKSITPIGGCNNFAEWVKASRPDLLKAKEVADLVNAKPAFSTMLHGSKFPASVGAA
jgi:hypothetical protein